MHSYSSQNVRKWRDCCNEESRNPRGQPRDTVVFRDQYDFRFYFAFRIKEWAVIKDAGTSRDSMYKWLNSETRGRDAIEQ